MRFSVAQLALSLILLETVEPSPYHTPPLHPRDTPQPPTTINTTIFSANGTNITPSFKTMIYYQPPPNSNPNTSSPNPNLTPRQNPYTRPINTCPSQTAAFVSSHCMHSLPFRGRKSGDTLQDYRIYCHEPPLLSASLATRLGRTNRTNENFNAGQRPPAPGRNGRCAEDEICVDSRFMLRVAYCVRKDLFVRMIMSGEPEPGSPLHQQQQQQDQQPPRKKSAGGGRELGGKVAQMFVSHGDGATPLQAREIDLKAGVREKIRAGETAVQERRCRGCFELETRRMGDGTDFLEGEATLMSTAAAVAAGVVWLVVSG